MRWIGSRKKAPATAIAKVLSYRKVRGNYIMNRRKKEEWRPKIIHRFKDGTVMTAEEFNKNPPTVPADHPASLALVRISYSMMEAG